MANEFAWRSLVGVLSGAVGRGLAWQYAGNLGAAVFGGGYLLLLGRRLGAAEFGLYSVCLAAATVAFMVSEMRLQEVAIRFLTDYRAKGDQSAAAAFLKAAVLLDIAVRLAALLLVFLLGDWIDRNLAKSEGSEVYVGLAAAGLFAARVGTTPAIGVLRVGGRFDLHAKIMLVDGIARLVAYGALDYAFGPGVGVALVAAIVSGIISNILMQIAASKILREWGLRVWSARLATLRDRAGELLRFAGSSYSISIFDVAVRELDTIVVAWYLSLADVAVYRMAKSFAQLLWRAGDPVFLVLMPEFARLWSDGRREQLRILVRRVTLSLLALAAFLLGAAYSVMPVIVGRALGAGYVRVIGIFPAASWWIAVSLPLIWTHALAYAIGKPHLQLVGNVVGNVSGFALLVVLTRYFGLIGAALGLSCAYAATFVVSWLMLRRYRWWELRGAL